MDVVLKYNASSNAEIFLLSPPGPHPHFLEILEFFRYFAEKFSPPRFCRMNAPYFLLYELLQGRVSS